MPYRLRLWNQMMAWYWRLWTIVTVGTAAYQLSRNLYRGLHEAADDYLTEVMETADGPLPPPAGSYLQRFGGLVDVTAAQRESA